eukprot:TRINITY_DN10730_c0_g1_i2.p1 TRINITY_DN10730_c0_g1~~TRINITY_DN10730_c0_g1_i2.p1  ORF type:complete len:273 (+),score=70.58 TRINITY_DN10730_c0_g1_i2:82-900(+)
MGREDEDDDGPRAAFRRAQQRAKEEEKEEAERGIQCALVEYVRGIRARKWTVQLGQTYTVGRAGGCVDIEVDHASLSRKHCSLAVTEVAMDHGSTNGTFVNKKRLEKGEGLKMKLAEVKHMVFGECENGYKFVMKSEETSSSSTAKSMKLSTGVTDAGASAESNPREEHVDAWARGGAADADGAQANVQANAQRSRKRPADEPQHSGPNRRERRAASAGASGSKDVLVRKDKSKSSWRSAEGDALAERVAAKHGSKTKGGEELKIDWPEDWK